ncbi:hypothetical protein GCM10011611_02790 [Aliidongia dinghuensis]|uniref:Uncharacterized protein n=1 Tax=Aliidongia dinghuensis TaxID=1867774 RepID=A0A8J2YPJ7_9PROT|nr:hypothetical protein GCM10011611_02790 [Aliidongia dinghuensis]
MSGLNLSRLSKTAPMPNVTLHGAGVAYSIASLFPCAIVTYLWAIKAEKSFRCKGEDVVVRTLETVR